MDISAVLGLSVEKLREQVITLAVEEILADRGNITEDVKAIVERHAADAARKLLAEKGETIVTTTIEAVLDGSFQRVNDWGEPVGQKTSIRNLFVNAVHTFYTEKVNEHGKVPNAYAREVVKTRAEWIAAKIVDEQVKGLLNEETTKIIKEATDAMRAAVKGALAAFVDRNFR